MRMCLVQDSSYMIWWCVVVVIYYVIFDFSHYQQQQRINARALLRYKSLNCCVVFIDLRRLLGYIVIQSWAPQYSATQSKNKNKKLYIDSFRLLLVAICHLLFGRVVSVIVNTSADSMSMYKCVICAFK